MKKTGIIGGLALIITTTLPFSSSGAIHLAGPDGAFTSNPKATTSQKDTTEPRCAFPIQGVKYVHPKNWQVKVAIDRCSENYAGFLDPTSFAEACGIDYHLLTEKRGMEFVILGGVLEGIYNTKGVPFKLLINELEEMYNCDCAWDGVRREVKIRTVKPEIIRTQRKLIEKKGAQIRRESVDSGAYYYSEPVYTTDSVGIYNPKDTSSLLDKHGM